MALSCADVPLSNYSLTTLPDEMSVSYKQHLKTRRLV